MIAGVEPRSRVFKIPAQTCKMIHRNVSMFVIEIFDSSGRSSAWCVSICQESCWGWRPARGCSTWRTHTTAAMTRTKGERHRYVLCSRVLVGIGWLTDLAHSHSHRTACSCMMTSSSWQIVTEPTPTAVVVCLPSVQATASLYVPQRHYT